MPKSIIKKNDWTLRSFTSQNDTLRNHVFINLFHLCAVSAEDDLLDFLCREFTNSFHGNFSCLFPGVAIDAGGNSGEGKRLATFFFGKRKAILIA